MCKQGDENKHQQAGTLDNQHQMEFKATETPSLPEPARPLPDLLRLLFSFLLDCPHVQQLKSAIIVSTTD